MGDLIPLRAYSIEKIRNLLRYSHVNLQDASQPVISVGRRYDAAYDAGFCCALALLEANKFEIKGPGHHRDTLEFMLKTLALKGDTAELVPALVRVRNSNRYDGNASVTEPMVNATIQWAKRVQAETQTWFEKHLPQGLKSDA